MIQLILLLIAASASTALPRGPLARPVPDLGLASTLSDCKERLLVNETFASPEVTSPDWELEFTGFEVTSNGAQVRSKLGHCDGPFAGEYPK